MADQPNPRTTSADREARAAYMRAWRALNPGKAAAASKVRRERNSDAINARRREKYAENPEAVLSRNAEWAARNVEKVRVVRRRYRERVGRNENRENATARHREWVSRNRDKVREYTRAYESDRLKRDIEFKLRKSVRGRILGAVKRGAKSARTYILVGCSIAELKRHLEALFLEGMSWANWGRGGWHIDHVKPLASFDLAIESQMLQACHFTNLQPLWQAENLSKGAKYAAL